MDSLLLNNKNIVITGASSGIGRAIAVECSKAGARILLFGRDQDRLNETLGLMKKGNHQVVPLDLTNFELIESPIAEFTNRNGFVGGFVHAAGIEFSAPFQLTKPQNFDNIFKINVIAGFEIARILSQNKYLDSELGASFVFISSIRALFGQNGAVAYSASKGAIRSGVKSLALELSKKKIRVNAIYPSIVLTRMTERWFDSIPAETKAAFIEQHPLGLGTPEDIANSCLFLLSDLSRWITGSDLVVDGGFSSK